jgi:hypothetical protein
MIRLLIVLILISTSSCAVEPDKYKDTKPTLEQTVYESTHTTGGVNIKSTRDFNNDGVSDILITHQEGYKPYTLLRSTSDGFVEETIHDDRAFIRNVTVDDFDADGDLDVYAYVHDGNGENVFLRNSGKQLSIEAPPSNTGSQFSHGGTSGDVDNDGDLDIFVANQNVNGVRGIPYFLINDGNGNFTPDSTKFNINLADHGSVNDASLYDYNNDNNIDLVLLYGESKNVRIAWNDGTGNFTINNSTHYEVSWPNQNNISTHVETNFNIEAATYTNWDYNDDGLMDIFVGHGIARQNGGWSATYIQVLENKGNKVFDDVTSTIIPVQSHIQDVTYDIGFPLNIDIADINNDNKKDIVIATNSKNDFIENSPYSEYPYVFFQQDDNTFSPATKNKFSEFGKSFYLRVGDFNGDKKDDIVGVEYINNGDQTFTSKVRIFYNEEVRNLN